MAVTVYSDLVFIACSWYFEIMTTCRDIKPAREHCKGGKALAE
jgi:hypothetical protein